MLAFVNTEMTKDAFMSNLRSHAECDEIVRGIGYNGHRGCLVGCSFNEYDHSRGPAIAGVPVELWHLADVIHEGLTDEPHLFPLQFGDAIRVSADLTKIHWQFLVWLLTNDTHGVKRFSGDPAWGVAAAIDKVSALCARMAVGDPVTEGDWSVARAEGDWAAASAARAVSVGCWSAENSARTASDATIGVKAAKCAARSAANTVSYVAVSVADLDAAYAAMRDKLIELIKAA